MHHGIYLLLGERLLPDEELLKVCRKLFALQELVFDAKEPVEWGTVRNHCTMAALLARLKQYDSMYDELKTVVKTAREFDMRSGKYSVSSVLLGEMKKEGPVLKHLIPEHFARLCGISGWQQRILMLSALWKNLIK